MAAKTLATYITECRRLLHDANGNFYTDAELTDYINIGRDQTVQDTGCLRTIQTLPTVASQETYAFASLPQAALTFDVLNINLYWGNTRVPLLYMAWSDFNARLRYMQNYTGAPRVFSIYGQNTIYLGPVPDQVYTKELDTIMLPTPMVASADADTILNPYDAPPAFYACYVAKFREQAYGEAEIFKQQYFQQARNVVATVFTRRLPTPYAQPY